jgi:hypothetical protein
MFTYEKYWVDRGKPTVDVIIFLTNLVTANGGERFIQRA